ncbi:MAG: UDP-N-acetylmuramate:L-alanyl-gamma-D-glutamyl-meso-diaminopimelate ligase [Desulfomonile tiedjei]|nr:UDP-N-acetylmuramate:L-alanyl-gamma-D-glutamyl-meso-diaminopimelate ligase [Desulfomonile tiedjei]
MPKIPIQSSTQRNANRSAHNGHVHLLGICGTGMASLAGMFHERGFRVSGSDQAMYPPMSDFLAELGVTVHEGYSPDNLDPRPDLAVVGNVIRRTNPEAVALEQSGVPFESMPVALIRHFSGDKTRIVVAGTHGKTTLSAMITWILHHAGLDPGFMIGGLVRNFAKNYRLGTGPFFVIEGDEYDTAYFDKRPKLLHYQPSIAVITSCEFDHADIYASLDQIEAQLAAFAGLVPRDGFLLACGDDPRVRALVANAAVPATLYGFGKGSNWSASEVHDSPEGIRASIVRNGSPVASATLPVFGRHNVLNAVAAIAAAHRVGVPVEQAILALGSFRGVKRRQEIVGEARGILVIDDFAHHPTAVQVTCAAVRSRFPRRRLVAVFEPRTNTSRRAVFQTEYVSALLDADLVLVREPRDVGHLPPSDRFSSRRLADDLRARGKTARAFDETDGILDYLASQLTEGDVVLIMSNGSFDNLSTRLLETLEG